MQVKDGCLFYSIIAASTLTNQLWIRVVINTYLRLHKHKCVSTIEYYQVRLSIYWRGQTVGQKNSCKVNKEHSFSLLFCNSYSPNNPKSNSDIMYICNTYTLKCSVLIQTYFLFNCLSYTHIHGVYHYTIIVVFIAIQFVLVCFWPLEIINLLSRCRSHLQL